MRETNLKRINRVVKLQADRLLVAGKKLNFWNGNMAQHIRTIIDLPTQNVLPQVLKDYNYEKIKFDAFITFHNNYK